MYHEYLETTVGMLYLLAPVVFTTGHSVITPCNEHTVSKANYINKNTMGKITRITNTVPIRVQWKPL